MPDAVTVVASAFDGVAVSYDAEFGANPIALYLRHVVQERARVLFPKRGRVLDLGCGTGEDALYLATLGHQVHALDVSSVMIERARAKAAARGVTNVSFEVLAAEEVGRLEGRFDGLLSNFGALNCADLPKVRRGLEGLLSRGAPLLLNVIGPRPLPALVQQALRGVRARSSEARAGGRVVPCRALSAGDVRSVFGGGFRWTAVRALGVIVPAPSHEGWARGNPILFGLAASLERIVRGWPIVRGLGDHILLEGTRA